MKTKILTTILLITTAMWAEGTVVLGGLEWQDNAETKTNKLNWEDAKSYCRELTLNGHSDWRLPNIKELQSIVDISRYDPAIKRGFKNATSSDCWSSSQDVSCAKFAWKVNFKYGDTGSNSKSFEHCVRCVRLRQ